MIDEMDLDALSQVEISDLAAIQAEIDTAAALWKARFDALQSALDTKFGEQAGALRLAEGKDTGTVHITEGGLNVACELRKTVEWDQPQLEALSDRIKAANEDPGVYMQVERKIKEAAYSTWPKAVRDAFDPARTVKPQKPKYVISDPNDKPKGRGRQR